MSTEVKRTEQEWRSLLTPEQYEVLRRRLRIGRSAAATWIPSRTCDRCAACGNELFDADAKFKIGHRLAELL